MSRKRKNGENGRLGAGNKLLVMVIPGFAAWKMGKPGLEKKRK